ncbi:chitobiase/beta-hexosaminidase C-terminal domain-containing protein [Paenibacillus sp. HB172176]|uniref:chitobiase/beta-hexosaminidase C-terminal domain-containing protein n=1 Tax=Paenibacillus sp. HB172176 TaxID=2493690 RepID=UPI00143BA7DA|nr:chitobiase/beta-hexosaminidase C-terminal domain-containing protein [Paenibacillus sp. HB172176]
MKRLLLCTGRVLLVLILITVMTLPDLIRNDSVAYADSKVIPELDSLNLWLKADTGLVMDGANISSWTDQSGQGNDLAQPTTGVGPTLTTMPTGYPAVSFNGTDQYLTRNLGSGYEGDYTIFMVVSAHADGSSGQKGFFASVNTAETLDTVHSFYYGAGGAAGKWKMYGKTTGGSANTDITTSGSYPDGYQLLTISSKRNGSGDAAETQTYLNGVLNKDVTNANQLAYRRFLDYVLGKGKGSYLRSDIAEVIVYREALNDTDRQSVETYLRSRYFTLPQVTAEPAPGTVPNGTEVKLSEAIQDAAIYYTTDGSDPADSSSRQLYMGSITVNGSMGIRASAALDGYEVSLVASFDYEGVDLQQVDGVFANPPAGIIDAGTLVSLSSGTVTAAVYYTNDGSDPKQSPSREVYDGGGIAIERNTVIQAYASAPGYLDSGTSSFDYHVKTEAVATSLSPGTVAAGTTVALTTATPVSSIYYTLDGSDPGTSASRELYTGPLTLNEDTMVSALAENSGMDSSDTSVFQYHVLVTAPNVAATPSEGQLFPGTSVTLTAGEGAEIYYTTDGSDPLVSMTAERYISPIPVQGEMTIKSFARIAGIEDGNAASFSYSLYESSVSVPNLSSEFYARDGLETMPQRDFSSMRVVNVADLGGEGDGTAEVTSAFDHAVQMLEAVGGGIVYIPAGVYRFSEPEEGDNAFWDPLYKGEGLVNIHFVGEGEDSIILFDQPGIESYSPEKHFNGWRFRQASNLTFRDLSFQFAPTFDMRAPHNSGYVLTFPGFQDIHNLQFIGVRIDQGRVGMAIWQGASDVWVVDCDVRNTAADAIHFSNVQHVVAAYNYIENAGDDSLANVSADLSEATPTALGSDDVSFLHNTIIGSRWGRGLIVGGSNQRVEGNWIEQTALTGILFLNATEGAGQLPASTSQAIVKNNTVIRAQLSDRPDNRLEGFQHGGAIAFINNLTNGELSGNRIFGSASNGISFGFATASEIDQLRIADNEIIGNGKSGILLGDKSSVDGLELSGNEVLSNGNESIEFTAGAMATNMLSSDNLLSSPPLISDQAVVTGETGGFEQTPQDGSELYSDVYKSVRMQADESGWEELPEIAVPENIIVNVKDFGATGDGLSNDLEAFNEAVAAIPSGGGTLKVPAGTYLLEPLPNTEDDSLTRIGHHWLIEGRQGIRIEGAGSDSVLQFSSADHQGLRLLNVQNVVLDSLTLELANQPQLRHNRALLDISGSENVEVRNVTINRSGGAGVLIDSSRMVHIHHNHINFAGMSGIEIAASRQVFVEGNDIVQSRDHAVLVTFAGSIERENQYIRIRGNRISGTLSGAGIASTSGTQVLIADNAIEDTYLPGILLYKAQNPFPSDIQEVRGNRMVNSNNGTHTYYKGAITLSNLAGGSVVLADNIVNGSVWNGIDAESSVLSALSIQDNRFVAIHGVTVHLPASNSIADLQQTEPLLQEMDTKPPIWLGGSKLSASAENISSKRVKLSWYAASDLFGVSKYKIYNNGVLVGETAGDALSFEANGLQADTIYEFTLQACDAAGQCSTDGPSLLVQTMKSAGGGEQNDTGGLNEPSESGNSESPSASDNNDIIVESGVIHGLEEPQVNPLTGIAGVHIDKAIVQKAWKQAAANAGPISIVISENKSATGYEIELPASLFASMDGPIPELKLKTSFASIVIPARAFSEWGKLLQADQLLIRIASIPVDKAFADEEDVQRFRNHPIIELTMRIDGEKVDLSALDTRLRIAIPYTLTQDEKVDPEFIVVYELNDSGHGIPIPGGHYALELQAAEFSFHQSSRFTIGYSRNSFNDLAGFDWVRHDIEVLASRGIINGSGNGAFSPASYMTRADFMVLLARTLQLKSEDWSRNFNDTQAGDYYYEALGIGRALGIISGTGGNRFEPQSPITWKDMSVMADRAWNAIGMTDLSGDGGRVSSSMYATRAEAALLLYQIYSKL